MTPSGTREPRIDLTILPDGEQYLTCPDHPDLRWRVRPDDGTDEGGVIRAIQLFRESLGA